MASERTSTSGPTRRTLLLAAGAAGSVAGSVTGMAPRAFAGPADSTLTAALQNDALSLDPLQDQSTIGLSLFGNIYDALTGIGRDGALEPRLASAWEPSPDGSVWTFTVRTGATFQDGTPVTPDDVVWTFRKALDDPRSPLRLYLALVKSVEAVEGNKVRFTLSAGFAPFDRQVTLISIVPRAAYERMGAQEFSKRPVGSGPFKVREWIKDDHVALDAYDGYWGGAPKVKRLVFRPVPSEASRAAGLLSGELDVVPDLPPALVPRLAAAPSIRVEKVATNRVAYLGFNTNVPPLDNVKFRQAIDCAIDRAAITGKLLQGLGVPMGAIVAPMTFGYDPALKPTSYDPALARRLIAEAGYRGDPLLLQYPNNRDAFADQVAQAIAGYLKDAGINVTLQGMEYGAFFPIWNGNKVTNIEFFAFGPSTLDGEVPLDSLYESGSHGYLKDPQLDALIRAQRSETDQAKRKALLGQAFARAREEASFAALYEVVQAYGVNKALDWKPRPDGYLVFRDASWSQS